ncbi:MAG: NAD(P)-binding protein [Marinomonas gallaica]
MEDHHPALQRYCSKMLFSSPRCQTPLLPTYKKSFNTMKYKITRRDFLNGMAMTVGAGLMAPTQLLGQVTPSEASSKASYYPPTLTGMRGNHTGAFEVSHALAWGGVKPARYRKLNQHYDLVVVGAGVSGLATARFYQQRMGPDAKILLLDNHDDFGGHAKRNEFHEDGRMLLGVGGSVNLDHPTDYSDAAKGLLDDLGIDLDAMKANYDKPTDTDSVISLKGPDGHVSIAGKWSTLVLGIGDYEPAIRVLPLPHSEQDKLIEFFSGDRDYLNELSLSEKQNYVESVSYAQFLTERVGLSEKTIPMFFSTLKLMGGPAASRFSVMEALYMGCPGIQGMSWLSELAEQIVASITSGEQSSLYFPDGNASVARLLVQKLIPTVVPDAKGFSDIATSRFDYGELDQAAHAVRLRLNSTVVGVQETGDRRVTVNYVQNSNAMSVTGDHCVLACYNGAIPHLCPQLPEGQKEALRYGVKVPLVWANVVLKNGHAWSKLGADRVSCPNDPYAVMTVAPPTTTGGHQPPRGPGDPMVVFMMGAPSVEPSSTETSRELLLKARHKLYATPFDAYEQEIRGQLQGVLGEHGFNHKTDIKAITVNRWSHGYAYEYMSLDDPKWAEGQAPHEIGRAQFGRISIANSDSEAYAYLDAAIDAGWRAVEEQTTLSKQK